MTTYAFIFARGGSKGLPGKNIRPLGGIPLITHSIRHAQALTDVTRIYVSTDSDEIADVAIRAGAEVIHRPSALASDTTPEWQAWQHAVEYLQQQDQNFDVFLSLPATSPLRSVDDIKKCLAALDTDTDMVITAAPASRHPCFNMIHRSDDGQSRLVMSNSSVDRRQDAHPVYDMTTVAYVTRPDFIMRNSGIFSGRVKSVLVPRERAIDIDEELDFLFAEALYHHVHHHTG
nr:acylneuraminate cytidylyltransferase family protein [Lacimicrobium alkaliphilum]